MVVVYGMYDEYLVTVVAVVVGVVREQLGCHVSEQQPAESVCEGRRFVWLRASLTILDITVRRVIDALLGRGLTMRRLPFAIHS